MPRWLKQILSYIISFVVYSSFINWKVALVLLGGIAFHECGHLYAAKSLGMRTKGFYLIPFMGGAALIADRYKKYSHLAYVALAGPIAGTVLTVITYVIYLSTGSAFIGSAAYWMAWLNAFNLIPLAMMDGGQLMESIVFSINELLGAICITISYAIAVFVLWHFNPVLVGLVIFIGLPHVMGVWRDHDLRNKGLGSLLYRNPEKMNFSNIMIVMGCYFLTIVVLLYLMHLCSLDSITLKDLFGR